MEIAVWRPVFESSTRDPHGWTHTDEFVTYVYANDLESAFWKAWFHAGARIGDALVVNPSSGDEENRDNLDIPFLIMQDGIWIMHEGKPYQRSVDWSRMSRFFIKVLHLGNPI